MKNRIIFMMLICIMALSLCSSVAAADDMNTTNLTSNKHIFINVSNDEGAKYNLDGTAYGGPNGTYYIKCDGGGLNALHITNNSSNQNGQVTLINATGTSSSGVFYLTDTGGRGFNDAIVLMVSVTGPIPDNFTLRIRSSGYGNWTLATPGAYNPSMPTDYQYLEGAIDQAFTKVDFQYGPQIYKPGPGTLGVWTLPLYYGQSTSDPSTAQYLMFIDLYVGTLKNSALIDGGAAKVEYWFTNMNTTASFNMYGWCAASNQGQGISWTQSTSGTGSSGYTVNYTPVTPAADFTADTTSGSDSLTVKFTDNSANYPTSWKWDFGDGTTSTEQNPTHTYSTPGTYTVKLTATNVAGNDTVTKTNYITVLDTIKPVVTADPAGGKYDTAKTVTLTANEQATIYYTTDGSNPTTSSTKYTGPISITKTTTLKFFAVDTAGNQSPVQSETYTIKSDVYVKVIPSKTNPQVGDNVTYTFKLGNDGPGVAKDVVFTYVIPEGVEFAGASVDQGKWSYDEATRTLTWELGDVEVGDPYLWLDLNILSSGSFNIQPTVSVAGYNPKLESNIGSLFVNAVSASPDTEDTSSNDTVTVNAATNTNTVPMQNTGMPLTGLTMALLLVGSGLALTRKK